MAEHDTIPERDGEEAIRATIAELVTRLHPKGTEAMREDEYDREYRGRLVCMNRDIFEAKEKLTNAVYCRACIEIDHFGVYKATRLVVIYEDDPLKNYPSIANVQCHRCGFDMHVAMKEKPNEDRARMEQMELLLRQFKEQQERQHSVYPQYGGLGGGIFDATHKQQQQMLDYEARRRLEETMTKMAPPPWVVKDKFVP
jgi:hypothetical protein